MTSYLSAEKECILPALYQALKLLSKAKRKSGILLPEEILIKEDRTPVTIYDFALQALFNMTLATYFPSDPIMGEEKAAELKRPENSHFAGRVVEVVTSFAPDASKSEIYDAIDLSLSSGGKKGRFWVIDPIDGTKGFIGRGQYCPALALIEEGKPIFGALACPRLKAGGHFESEKGVILMAIKNRGTKAIHLTSDMSHGVQVRALGKEEELIYCEPPSYVTRHSSTLAKKLVRLLHDRSRSLKLDGQVKYAAVALGLAPLYFRFPKKGRAAEKIWDHAAGALIVQEAGGKVTDLLGQSLDFGAGITLANNWGLIASSGEPLHSLTERAARSLLEPQ